jgi:hypothetical protein
MSDGELHLLGRTHGAEGIPALELLARVVLPQVTGQREVRLTSSPPPPPPPSPAPPPLTYYMRRMHIRV